MERAGKAGGRTPAMYGHGKSDRSVVPEMQVNKVRLRTAEPTEGRGLAKGNSLRSDTSRTQSRMDGVTSGLERVRLAAKRDKDARFTALMHHATDRLEEAYWRTKPKASPGVDGVTWKQYGENLRENLKDLLARLQRGGYRAKPSRRAYIPKEDGRLRPLGVASLEDKVVQGAVVTVLNAIYECDFLGFSYGFRPGRGQHNALDALTVGLHRQVSWVLDADIRCYYDAIDHEWLLRFLEHRIADRRILRLIRKWLNAGVLEDGELTKSLVGTPQGATVSPLLSNVYLHYVFDLWANQWRKRHARGDVIIVRYADDCAPRRRGRGATSGHLEAALLHKG
ncbi:MAG: reverse transcriptase domain-containing protein [Acidimicrobiia bacterium]|nr:reverse transcriptase domain-containing protein [Acidimicrobiia bacterium]